jgi:hypothetical protein
MFATRGQWGDRVERQQVLLGGVTLGGITLFPRSLNKTKNCFSIQTLSLSFFLSVQDKQHRLLLDNVKEDKNVMVYFFVRTITMVIAELFYLCTLYFNFGFVVDNTA